MPVHQDVKTMPVEKSSQHTDTDFEIANAAEIDAIPITRARPVPRELDRYINNPGLPRAAKAIDKEHPNGTENHPVQNRSVLQQHVDFFDDNLDGVITLGETYRGFRRLGYNFITSALAMVLIHLMMSYASQDSWIPSLTFDIKVRNIHRCKHGSDSEVYDTEGRFVPEKFEEIFSKYDKDLDGSLNWSELVDMLKSQRNAWDWIGWMAATLEWAFTFVLLQENGHIKKDKLRGALDGSLFWRIAQQNAVGSNKDKEIRLMQEYYHRTSAPSWHPEFMHKHHKAEVSGVGVGAPSMVAPGMGTSGMGTSGMGTSAASTSSIPSEISTAPHYAKHEHMHAVGSGCVTDTVKRIEHEAKQHSFEPQSKKII